MYVKAIKKLAAILSILSLVFISSVMTDTVVSAKEKDGTFTVICLDGETAVAGMEWKIYRVGKRHKNSNYFNLDGHFKNYKVAVNYSDSDSAGKTAATLENYAFLDGINPDDTGVTDKKGIYKFEGLKEGVYIAAGKKIRIGNITYKPAVVLFEICHDLEGGNTGKDVVSYVKISTTVHDDDSETEEMEFTVKNIWDDGDNEKRPDKVKVEIYRDNELYIEIELSDENNWTHKWDGSPDDDWRVKVENIPDDYTVIYDNKDTDFAVVNTFNPNDPNNPYFPPPTTETIVTTVYTDTSSQTEITSNSDVPNVSQTDETVTSVTVATTTAVTTVSDTQTSTEKATVTTTKKETFTNTGGKLPQTGQLWWPVFALGGVGVVVLSYGIRVTADRKCDDDE